MELHQITHSKLNLMDDKGNKFEGDQFCEDIVQDQVTSASNALPLSDGSANAAISTEYSREDHVHPLNITTTIPISNSASGSIGTCNYFAKNGHYHPINITTTISPQDSASRSVGTTNYYARNDHLQLDNVEINASNIPIINGVGVNGTSAFYARHDHVHPQQLTYDRNVTAIKFIKTGGLATEILCANGDKKALSEFDSDSVKKTGQELQVIEGTIRKKDDNEKSIAGDYLTRKEITDNYVTIVTDQTITGIKTFNSFMKTNVIAGIGATDGASNGSVNYSAGKLIMHNTTSQCLQLLADETTALNLNCKNIYLTNVTYGEAMIFLPEFNEIKYSTKEKYT
ncbi:MAG: hypothetical protein EZS28_028689 [Streblomastix strix]|uniref:Uncharacterized protein n=1 Tax=Streblomastix strix TaxID=222440 RepID=A0A5J4UZW4_9EUKA|nr:MAG: hypothetical protein EZS28_028689 [Streblomastix strix]